MSTKKKNQLGMNPSTASNRLVKDVLWKLVVETGQDNCYRCDSKMFQDLIFPNASAIMFVKGRIKFYRPDGTQGDSPGCGSVLIAFGEENAKILEYSNIPGKYIKLNN
jgi:hypothetical protein